MKIKFLLAMLFLVQLNVAPAQDKLLLQHVKHSKRQKNVKTDHDYAIKTNDTTYYSEIVGFTDSTLSILIFVKDTGISSYTRNINGRDSIFYYNKYVYDTLAISLTDIVKLKKPWFNNQHWMEPFGWLGLGFGMAFVFGPVLAAVQGDGAMIPQMLLQSGSGLATCALVVFIGTRSVNYDLNKKWKLKTLETVKG